MGTIVKKIVFLVVCLMLVNSFALAGVKEQELTASSAHMLDRFGWSVSISGDGNVIAVGAPFDDIGRNLDQGSVYIFVRRQRQWIQQQKLTAVDGAAGDRFGLSLSISSDGNTLVIGVPYIKISEKREQGSAYVFVRSGEQWIQQQKLTAWDGSVDDQFSHSVFLSGSGNLIVGGAPEKTINKNPSQGSVYVLPEGPVPNFTTKEWSIILIALLAGFGSLYYLRRRRRGKS